MSASAAEVGVGREVIWADGWRLTMHVEVRRGPHCKGQILSARDLPTGCQQQCSLVVPTVRATTSDRTERQVTSKQPTKRPEREGRCGPASTRISLPARCSDRRPAADDPDPAPATAPGGGHRWPGHRLRDHPRVNRMVAATATHPTAPQAAEPFRDPPGEAIGVATSAGQAEGETYALLFGSGFIVQVMSLQQVDARAPPGADAEIWTIELP
jgi:hypothetical protein